MAFEKIGHILVFKTKHNYNGSFFPSSLKLSAYIYLHADIYNDPMQKRTQKPVKYLR